MNDTLHTVAQILQVLSALAVILLVLLQHGKGADMGAAFGSGASGSLFGATGSANFLSRMTAVSAAVFFASTLLLAFVTVSRPLRGGSVMDGQAPVTAPSTPPTGGATGSDVPLAPGSRPPPGPQPQTAVPALPPAAPTSSKPDATTPGASRDNATDSTVPAAPVSPGGSH